MPYWDHLGAFLKYFERLSYLLSQGVHQSDITVLYPVTPGQAQRDGKAAADTAFETGTQLFGSGRDFIFIDDDSIARARIEGGRLHVADTSYRVLILPAMRAVRWATLLKAQAFFRAGGIVVAMGALPEASDRAGREDTELDGIVRELFGASAAEVNSGVRASPQQHASGGRGVPLPSGESGWPRLVEVLRPIPMDVVSEGGAKAVHRRVGMREVYFVTGASKGAEVTFRARGQAEQWDPWTGEVRPIHQATPVAGGTRLRLSGDASEAQLIVFSPGEPQGAVTTTDLDEVSQVTQREGRIVVTGLAKQVGRKSATVMWKGRRVDVHGDAAPGTTVNLEGDWEFELKPTMDNRWGDFRLPITERVIGPEARLFRYAEETSPHSEWSAAALKDSDWPRVTGGFGPKFWKLGPLPADADVAGLEARLAATSRLDPSQPVVVDGRSYAWSAYAFSWRWGREGDPGHQGWHGLKENISDDFLCLGKATDGHNEKVYREEPGGTRYYLWTTAFAGRATRVRIHRAGLEPAALYLNGKPVSKTIDEGDVESGPNALLVRYDGPGRGHLVLQEASAVRDLPERRTPLAMRWFDVAGVIPFDTRPGDREPVGWYRFTAPPGLRSFTVTAHGPIQVWVDGRPSRVGEPQPSQLWKGAEVFPVRVEDPPTGASQVALRIVQQRGCYGGAALPEPIVLDCGPGRRALGDWSKGSVLENYSGGAWYRRDVVLDAAQTRGRIRLDLGQVVATAEVLVNGKSAGIRVAPPWSVDLTGTMQAGTNRLAILVYNTLANHYLTIPTKFRGELTSGLLGPVRLAIQPETTLTE